MYARSCDCVGVFIVPTMLLLSFLDLHKLFVSFVYFLRPLAAGERSSPAQCFEFAREHLKTCFK